ncbi:MAG: hypothetical protein U1E76_06235 [Planctomycetota bacterium]
MNTEPPSPPCPRCATPLERRQDPPRFECAQHHGLLVAATGVRSWLLAHESAAPGAVRCPSCRAPMTACVVDTASAHRCEPCQQFWIETPAGKPDEIAALLLYAASVPERAARGAVNLAGGLVSEIARMIVPRSFQSSKTYEVLVQSSLSFLVEQVGRVGDAPPEAASADGSQDQFLARKAVGNFVDMAGLATLHVSPLWLLAIVADVAYGSSAFLHELTGELRQQGLIERDSVIDHTEDLLRALNRASATSASLFDTPPLNVNDLKQTLEQTRAALGALDVTRLLPRQELESLLAEMNQIAERERASLFQVSSTMAMFALEKVAALGRGAWTGATVASKLLDRHILGHYRAALDDIVRRGLFATLSDISSPYLRTVYDNFSRSRATLTEQLLRGTLFTRWKQKIGQFLRRKP